MQFTWNNTKDETNQRKHGVSFDIAKYVFADPFHISRQDRIENGEIRWQTIGIVQGAVLLLVAHTITDQFGEHIRIISARRAEKHERRLYEEGK